MENTRYQENRAVFENCSQRLEKEERRKRKNEREAKFDNGSEFLGMIGKLASVSERLTNVKQAI